MTICSVTSKSQWHWTNDINNWSWSCSCCSTAVDMWSKFRYLHLHPPAFTTINASTCIYNNRVPFNSPTCLYIPSLLFWVPCSLPPLISCPLWSFSFRYWWGVSHMALCEAAAGHMRPFQEPSWAWGLPKGQTRHTLSSAGGRRQWGSAEGGGGRGARQWRCRAAGVAMYRAAKRAEMEGEMGGGESWSWGEQETRKVLA